MTTKARSARWLSWQTMWRCAVSLSKTASMAAPSPMRNREQTRSSMRRVFRWTRQDIRPAARARRRRLPKAGLARARDDPVRRNVFLWRDRRHDRRAAGGAANGRNAIPVIVPCHRVIGADGSLTGFRGGMERKRFLLALEGGEPAVVDVRICAPPRDGVSRSSPRRRAPRGAQLELAARLSSPSSYRGRLARRRNLF